MKVIAQAIDRLNLLMGKLASWLCIALILLICYDVLMRNAFQRTDVIYFEVEWHLFAGIFLIGSAYALQQDKHVRVDVIYGKLSARTQAAIDLLGTLVFLTPFCYIGIKYGLIYTWESWLVGESSPDPGGLPARYVIKSLIPLAFLLLLLQGLSKAVAQFQTIFSPTNPNHEQH